MVNLNYQSIPPSNPQVTSSTQSSSSEPSCNPTNIMKVFLLTLCLFYILPTILSYTHLPYISSREAQLFIQPDPPNTTSLSSTLPKAKFALRNYQVGFGRIMNGGVVVQLGTGASISFHIRAKGVDSNTLAKADKDIRTVLNVSRAVNVKKRLDELQSQYNGGLNVPFLNMLGFDLDKELNLTRVELVSRDLIDALGLQTFNKLSKVANETIRSFTNTEVVMKGNVEFIGESFSPEVLLAYIKLVRVNYLDGTGITILGAAKEDVVERSDKGVFSNVAGADITVESVKMKKDVPLDRVRETTE